MLAWIAQLAASGIFKAFGDTIVSPLLKTYLASRNIDAQQLSTMAASQEHLVASVVAANEKFAETKATLITGVLNWWPFRLVLFVVLAACAARFCLIMADATLPKIFHYQPWDIDPLKGNYGRAELEYILFFVVAKPVDSAVTGALGVITAWLARRK